MLFPVINSQPDTMNEGTSLPPHMQIELQNILRREGVKRILNRANKLQMIADSDSITLKKEKLLGCWVDGTLRFQSRDHEAIHEYAARRMREKHSVWVAPVGSFVTV